MLSPQAYLQISSISALLTYQLRIPRVIRNEHKRVILDERQGKSEPIDEGRYVATKNEPDKYVFKSPVLRNVAKTAPYFHDGSIDKLEEAVLIMGKVQLGRDLTKVQVEEIVAFLKSLTGIIPQEALTVPLLPSTD